MNLSGTETGIRNKPAAEILPASGLTPLRKPDLKKENRPEAVPIGPSSAVLTPKEARQVEAKFSPLPVTLNKALSGIQTLRRQVQEVEQSVRPSAAALPQPPRRENPPLTNSKPPQPVETANLNNAKISPPLNRGSGPESMAGTPEAPKGMGLPFAPVKNETAATPKPGSNTMPEIPRASSPTTPPVEEKLNAVFPGITGAAARPSAVPTPKGTAPPPAAAVQMPVMEGTEKTRANVTVAGQGSARSAQAVPGTGAILKQGTPGEEIVQAPIRPVLGPSPEKNVPPAAILAPQPPISTVQPSPAPPLDAFQSQTKTARPLVVPFGAPTHPAMSERERIYQAFQQKLRTGGVQNFIVQAHQAVQLAGVPIIHMAAMPGVVTQPSVENTVPALSAVSPLPGTSLQVKPFLSTVETVAQQPVRSDNEGQPRVIQGTEMKTPAPKNGNGTPGSPALTVTAPSGPAVPLSNMNPLPRPLPTNVRARLVPAPTVNLLDLVL